MEDQILNVRAFPQVQQPHIDFLLRPLQFLFTQRNYPMDIPQRVHFHLAILFTQGQGQHMVDFRSYPYHAQTLFFVAENQVQQWEINLASQGFVLAFSKEFLYQKAQDRAILQQYRIFDFTLQSPSLSLNEQDYAGFLRLFQELQQEFEHPDDDSFKAEILRNLLRTLLLRAERLKSTQTVSPVFRYQDFVRFKEQVEQAFRSTRNVQDYASMLGYSPKKLNQLTLEVLNKNAKAFIDERVVLEIKRLLIHTDLSIKEIAVHTGFDEPTNLVKFFKRYTQQTPLAFRSQLFQGADLP